MVILSKKAINDFILTAPDSADDLLKWYEITKQADWANFAEMKKSFSDVDAAGNDRYVFNIRRNRYRLICVVHFNVRTVYIVFIGTHQEYDRITASKVKYKK